jgi:hypothetical protein
MVSEFGIAILPDLLANDLDLVIVGAAAGRISAERRLYYAGPGNRFWRIAQEVGLTPIELRPGDYAKLRPAIMPIPEVQIFGGESTDDGRTWQSAILGENLGKYSFREWKIPVRLTLTSFRRRDEMNGIGLLASIPRFLRKGVGDHGIFEKQPHAK